MFHRMFLALCLCCVYLCASPVLAQDAADVFGSDAVTAPDSVATDAPATGSVVDAVAPPVTPPKPAPATISPADRVKALVSTVAEWLALIGGFIVGLVFIFMEAAKGGLPRFAGKSKKFKAIIAIGMGSILGLIASLIPVLGLDWWVGLIVGTLSGMSAAGVRAFGKNGPARTMALMLVCVAGLTLTACGTTFTAKAGDQVTTSIKVGPPGQVLVKIADKTACTVNTNADGKVKIRNVCKAGFVPWYDDTTTICIADPCQTGTLKHLPDATVGCK